ncbi:GNAT family N-acetyltransferase [Lachnospiraceae bacterium 38-14]|uniref:GNAT family N-acetyltransferase n=1 Tax=Roseburia sp. 1XD42-69 TaxID=2320088 RepID=UPI0013146A12|nr:GNAT family N-acetyltransferase [Roseburia sp. 1XD42-69]MCX4354576.1 GNAT family N-acetyltransferase [Lachnospiraceae bacterium]
MMIEIHDDLNADEYNKLRVEVGWEIKNPLIVEKAIRNSTIIKKATYDNKIVGMARAIGDGMSYLLVDVVVSSKYQKQGIGKKLVNSIIDDIKNETMTGEYSTINLISIRGMEKFYKSCGFEVVPFGYNGKGMRMKIEK